MSRNQFPSSEKCQWYFLITRLVPISRSFYGNFFLALVRRTKRILRDPDCENFFVQRKRDRSNDSESGKTFHNLTFSINCVLLRSAIILPLDEMSRGNVRYARAEWNWNCRCLFRALTTRCYYFNERCSLASRYLIGRSTRQRYVGWLYWTFIHGIFPAHIWTLLNA